MPSRSPTPGCLIGITALVVFGLIAIWTGYTGYTQNKEISKFTSPEPVNLGIQYRDSDTVIDLRRRVRDFGEAVEEGQAPSLELSVADLNDLIGHEDALFDLRPMVAVQGIQQGLVTARVAFPMQTLFQGGKLRYLNATATFKPEVEEGQLMLKIVDLKPDVGGTVPEGFLNFISGNLNLVAPFRENKQIGPVLERIDSIATQDGRLILKTRPQ